MSRLANKEARIKIGEIDLNPEESMAVRVAVEMALMSLNNLERRKGWGEKASLVEGCLMMVQLHIFKERKDR